MSTFNVDWIIDLGYAGEINIEVPVDITEHLTSRDLAEHVGLDDALDFHGQDEFLEHISYQNIVDFVMGNESLLGHVIEALEDKYSDE